MPDEPSNDLDAQLFALFDESEPASRPSRPVQQVPLSAMKEIDEQREEARFIDRIPPDLRPVLIVCAAAVVLAVLALVVVRRSNSDEVKTAAGSTQTTLRRAPGTTTTVPSSSSSAVPTPPIDSQATDAATGTSVPAVTAAPTTARPSTSPRSTPAPKVFGPGATTAPTTTAAPPTTPPPTEPPAETTTTTTTPSGPQVIFTDGFADATLGEVPPGWTPYPDGFVTVQYGSPKYVHNNTTAPTISRLVAGNPLWGNYRIRSSVRAAIADTAGTVVVGVAARYQNADAYEFCRIDEGARKLQVGRREAGTDQVGAEADFVPPANLSDSIELTFTVNGDLLECGITNGPTIQSNDSLTQGNIAILGTGSVDVFSVEVTTL